MLKHTERKRSKSRAKRKQRVYRSQAKSRDIVSDHAIVRYLERVKDVNIGALRREILGPVGRDAIRAGAKVVKTDRAILTIEGGRVVTVTPR